MGAGGGQHAVRASHGDAAARVFLCQQVPVPSLPSGVHETGKAVEKADAMFPQERDPRFAEMFAGIGACERPGGGQRVCAWLTVAARLGRDTDRPPVGTGRPGSTH